MNTYNDSKEEQEEKFIDEHISFKDSETARIKVKVAKNTWVWLMSLLLGVDILITIVHLTTILTLIINTITCVLSLAFLCKDIAEIRETGEKGLWVIWGLFIVPVYLFIRAYKVDKKYWYAIVYTALDIFTIVNQLIMGMSTLKAFVG